VKFQEILSFAIQVDGSMAHWTPYMSFMWRDKLSHKGVKMLYFRKPVDGKLFILSIPAESKPKLFYL
jgi:hypothetical protein